MLSPKNSTQTNIADGDSWQGPADEVAEFAGVSISIYSDVDLDVYVEQSLNATSWEFSEHIAYIAATEASTTYNLRYRYYRLRISNNSGGDSTELRACSKLHKGLPVEEPLEVTGTFTASEPESVAVFGYGVAYPTAPTMISSIRVAGNRYTPQTLAHALELLSSDAADAAAGTGAQSIELQGINSGGIAVTETLATNGTSVVISSVSWSRLNRAVVVTAGTGQTNAGTITIRMAGGGATQAVIQPDEGESSALQYRAPSNRRLKLQGLTVSSRDQGTWHTTALYAYLDGVKRLVFKSERTDGDDPSEYHLGGRELPAGSEIALEVQTDTGGSLNVYAGLKIDLVE